MTATSEKKQDNCSQVQEKRHVILSHSTYFPDKYMTVGKTKYVLSAHGLYFFRVLKKQTDGGSSVILIKMAVHSTALMFNVGCYLLLVLPLRRDCLLWFYHRKTFLHFLLVLIHKLDVYHSFDCTSDLVPLIYFL